MPKRFQFETVSVDTQGNITERENREAEFFTEELGNNLSLDMVAIPGGSFIMGSPESEVGNEDNEQPQRAVTVNPFHIGKFVITQAQWNEVAEWPQVNRELEPQVNRELKPKSSSSKESNIPVTNVSWEDATEFCARLSKLKGKHYRLPSEAEWEYACRAGTVTPFHFGETVTTRLANYDGRNAYGQEPKSEHRDKIIEVGSFPANAFGLYDMHGNVWEWCEDHWHSNYTGAPKDGSAWLDPDAAIDAPHIVRGGHYYSSPESCRSASRYALLEDSTYPGDRLRIVIDRLKTGFRVVCNT